MDYTPENVAKISGVSAKDIRYLASLYGDPDKKVTSFWCMGMNQHTRGTWINNLVYNCHLLVGKISQPGNSPFSLTGQPSACGTVREVDTLIHKLPHYCSLSSQDGPRIPGKATSAGFIKMRLRRLMIKSMSNPSWPCRMIPFW